MRIDNNANKQSLMSPITVSPTQALQSNLSKVNTLHLSNVTMEDAGEYMCMAETTHKGHTLQTMHSAWLDVLPGKHLILRLLTGNLICPQYSSLWLPPMLVILECEL